MDCSSALVDSCFLENKNPVPEFDQCVTFYDFYQCPKSNKTKEHVYVVVTPSSPSSSLYEFTTTTFVHSFFPHFDADVVIRKMMKGKNWTTSKYFGKTANEIKKEWAENGKSASSLGTKMHASIEDFYNHSANLYQKTEAELLPILSNFSPWKTPEFKQFLVFHFSGPYQWKWIPWRTELRVYDAELQVAGSVDMLYQSPNYTTENKLLIMLDWKRSKEIKKDNPWETALPPVQDLPSANYYQYSLQLNIYKYIIEKNTPYRIEYMGLGVFHPNHHSYEFYEVHSMPSYVKKMTEHRMNQLRK